MYYYPHFIDESSVGEANTEMYVGYVICPCYVTHRFWSRDSNLCLSNRHSTLIQQQNGKETEALRHKLPRISLYTPSNVYLLIYLPFSPLRRRSLFLKVLSIVQFYLFPFLHISAFYRQLSNLSVSSSWCFQPLRKGIS